MSNEYAVAQAIELGRAADLLLGNKYVDDHDVLTGLHGTRVMDDLEETGNGAFPAGRRKTMINHYELADVLELGRAQDIVLGNKALALDIDSNTMVFFSCVYDWMSDEE